jgi:hypothetical protein
MSKYVRLLSVPVVVLALSLLGVTAASARPHPAGIHNAPTAACNVMDPSCTEPVVAQAFNPVQDLSPSSDFAMTYVGGDPNLGVPGGKVNIGLNNNLDNGTQDWDFNNIGFVPPPGTDPPFPFGLTAFDLQNYNGDPLVEIEYTPFGQDSGLCASSNKTNHIVLQWCASVRNQVWIIDPTLPFVNPAPPPYTFGLLVKQAATAQHHLCLTAPTAPSDLPGQLTSQRCTFFQPATADDQMWSAIP